MGSSRAGVSVTTAGRVALSSIRRQAAALGLGTQAVQQGQAGVIGPLQIVDQQEQRPLAGQLEQQLQHGLLPFFGWASQHSVGLGGALALQGAQHLQIGLQGLGAEVALAVTAQHAAVAIGGAAQEFFGQPGLADAGAGAQAQPLRLAGAGLIEALLHQGQLGGASDKRRQAAALAGLEAPADADLAQDAVDRQRRGAAFERHQAGARWSGKRGAAGPGFRR